MKVIQTILTIIIAVIVMFGLVVVLRYCSEDIDKQYCYGLQAQAEQYRNFTWSENNPGGFYITKIDKAQCDHFNIKINAPVR